MLVKTPWGVREYDIECLTCFLTTEQILALSALSRKWERKGFSDLYISEAESRVLEILGPSAVLIYRGYCELRGYHKSRPDYKMAHLEARPVGKKKRKSVLDLALEMFGELQDYEREAFRQMVAQPRAKGLEKRKRQLDEWRSAAIMLGAEADASNSSVAQILRRVVASAPSPA